MEQKKDNTILIRLSDDEMRVLNDGWFQAVSLAGRPVTKSEYIRACIRYTGGYLNNLKKADVAKSVDFLDPCKYDYLTEED